MRNTYRILVRKLKVRDRSEDLGIDGKVTFEWVLGKSGGKVQTKLIWLKIGTSG
jgi:hypothetical protein